LIVWHYVSTMNIKIPAKYQKRILNSFRVIQFILNSKWRLSSMLLYARQFYTVLFCDHRRCQYIQKMAKVYLLWFTCTATSNIWPNPYTLALQYTAHAHNSGICYSISSVNELVLTFPVLNVYTKFGKNWARNARARVRTNRHAHTERHTNTPTHAQTQLIL
jgi:hypothetical protein